VTKGALNRRRIAGVAFFPGGLPERSQGASILSGLLNSLAAGLEGIKQPEVIVVDNGPHDRSVDFGLTQSALKSFERPQCWLPSCT